MTVSQDGKIIALSRKSNQIELWKTERMTLLKVISGHADLDVRNVHWLEYPTGTEIDQNILYQCRADAKK